MAKGPTITTIASGYYSRTALNTNFTNIDAAFDNTLSLDGSTPNSMQGDLDLNGNQITNGVGKFSTLYLDNVLAGNLATAFTFLGAWVTGTSYSAYDVVTDSGNTYIALETHTAGSTFSTDLSAAKWSVLATKGASGAGTGDMLVANNLSDVANVATSRSNLGLGASDSPTFTNISPTGTVDGRDLAVDGAKLDLLDQGLATTDSPTFDVVTAASFTGDGAVTPTSGTAPYYGVRSWCKFDGSGISGLNCSIAGSGNVASVLKTASGTFTLTFSTAMPDANYSITYSAGTGSVRSDTSQTSINVFSQTTSGFEFSTSDASSNNYSDRERNYITVVG